MYKILEEIVKCSQCKYGAVETEEDIEHCNACEDFKCFEPEKENE